MCFTDGLLVNRGIQASSDGCFLESVGCFHSRGRTLPAPMLPARQAEAVTRLPHQPPGRSEWPGEQQTLGGSVSIALDA
jgi:hypothetical protein